MSLETPRKIQMLQRKLYQGEQLVRDNARFLSSTHRIAASGYHSFRVWMMMDPGVVWSHRHRYTGLGEMSELPGVNGEFRAAR